MTISDLEKFNLMKNNLEDRSLTLILLKLCLKTRAIYYH